MPDILHITNGDSATSTMQEIALAGKHLAWRDLLHEGPVPADLSLVELSAVRAQYIAAQGWGEYAQIYQSFIQRDATLACAQQFDKIILWFEHDLYDQLQLLQILAWFHEQQTSHKALYLICIDDYLGTLSTEQFRALVGSEARVCQQQLSLAQRAWQAFRQPTPLAWQALAEQDTTALPFLGAAIKRMLEEYPSSSSGLGRSAAVALSLLQQQEFNARALFTHYQALEARRFLGDWSFFRQLQRLSQGPQPLLKSADNKPIWQTSTQALNDSALHLTQHGINALSEQHPYRTTQMLDQWIGGVYLCPSEHWLWDNHRQCLQAYIQQQQ